MNRAAQSTTRSRAWAALGFFGLWAAVIVGGGCRRSGNTLVKAVILGQKDEVVRLLDGGAKVDALGLVKDRNLERLLIGVSEKEVADDEAVKKVIGVETIRFSGKVELTALMAAAATDNLDLARLLLERGAKVDAANSEGATAIKVAAGHKHLEMVRFLLERGASAEGLDPDLLKAAREPSAAAAAAPLRVGGDVPAPEIVSRVEPAYPELAKQARVQGTVILEATIDENGNVTQARVLRGLPLGLSEAAVEAVMKWKYRPAVVREQAVPVLLVISLRIPSTK